MSLRRFRAAVRHTQEEVHRGDPESGRDTAAAVRLHSRGSSQKRQRVSHTQEGVHIRDPESGRHNRSSQAHTRGGSY